MTDATIASFNVKNLIGPNREYYRFQSYTPEEYARKECWIAGQLLTMNADIVGFQEIFEEAPLQSVLNETSCRAKAQAAIVPDRSKPYHGNAVLARLRTEGYAGAALAFAPIRQTRARRGSAGRALPSSRASALPSRPRSSRTFPHR